MSSHPDNPWWDSASDRPISISSRDAWDRAESAGYLTIDHVLLRLEAMLRVAVGEPTDRGSAYDEDGFVRALVDAGWSGEGWRIQLHPNDHDPPHVHFREKGEPKNSIRLSLVTGDPLPDESVGPGLRRKLGKAQAFILERQEMLMARWSEAQA